MRSAPKYLWGSACILYVLSLVSALALGYVGWWLLLVVVLALGTFAMWRRAV